MPVAVQLAQVEQSKSETQRVRPMTRKRAKSKRDARPPNRLPDWSRPHPFPPRSSAVARLAAGGDAVINCGRPVRGVVVTGGAYAWRAGLTVHYPGLNLGLSGC